jgi:hypothetical protein
MVWDSTVAPLNPTRTPRSRSPNWSTERTWYATAQLPTLTSAVMRGCTIVSNEIAFAVSRIDDHCTVGTAPVGVQ